MGDGHGIEESTLVTKRAARQRFREYILSSWGHCCAYCEAEGAVTLDHVRPRSKGGQTTASNLVAACCRCNRKKGSEGWEAWYEAQEFFSRARADRIRRWLAREEAGAA